MSLGTGRARLFRSALLPLMAALLLPGAAFANPPGDWLQASAASFNGSGGPAIGIESLTRTPVLGDVVHYKAVVRLGSGPFDKIGLHRVVRESAPWVPIVAPHGVMLLHGDVSTFETAFLLTALSTEVPAGHALSVYLAQHGIDVWGVDRRWTFVPDATVDVSPMANMGFAVAIADTRIALTLARLARALTGSGFNKMILGGWSRGGEISYAVANDEAVRPPLQQNLKGLLPIDVPIRYSPADQAFRTAVCNSYTKSKLQYDAGLYSDTSGLLAKQAANLDILLPAGPSPLIPGFTNHQVVLVLMTQSYVLADPVPWFHFAAGTFNLLGLPTGLQYTNYNHIRNWFVNAPGHQARLETLDGFALVCETPNLPFDDHLVQITVPTFYIGAAGGFGAAGIYSTTLLGSSDVQTQVISLHPASEPALDFGHADMMYATAAPALVWQPIASWIAAH